jgi:two-component system, NtrC family, response regulator AtoC
MTQILIVDDDYDTREALGCVLTDSGYSIEACASAEEALRALEAKDFDLILSDVMMPKVGGTEFCAHVVRNHPDVPVIMITAYGSTDVAVDAIRAGAFDFLTKPFDLADLGKTLTRALDERGDRRVRRLEGAAREAHEFPEIVGTSLSIGKVIEQLSRIAASEATVLITGESGTGKELVARAIHERSRRRAGPFVAVNCAAVPADILESELFGRVRGAFTGATAAYAGLFREADGGTLFLDEVGAMPSALQPKLLRALQERAVRPVGGDAEEPFDARMVAATNCDLDDAVQAGTFREDLRFRLGVLCVSLPPLRDRGEDVIEIARYLIAKYGSIEGRAEYELTQETQRAFLRYRWPGNVRELENCVQAALTFAAQGRIEFEDLPTAVRVSGASPGQRSTSTDPSSLEKVELEHILRVLEAVGGNKAAAARVLRIDRTTLYRKLERADTRGLLADRDRSV